MKYLKSIFISISVQGKRRILITAFGSSNLHSNLHLRVAEMKKCKEEEKLFVLLPFPSLFFLVQILILADD